AVAWLTLDAIDRACGRLLVYLEAALAREAPEVAGAVTGALASGVSHIEAAGLLAEAVEGIPLVLVIDELERIADSEDALDVLAAFVRYAPPSLRMVLVARREVALDL